MTAVDDTKPICLATDSFFHAPISQSAVIRNIFPQRSRLGVFKETPAEELTEANSHAKLSCSNLLLNDDIVVCIWFSEKQTIHISYTEKFTE